MQAIQYETVGDKKFNKPGTERITYYMFRCGYIQESAQRHLMDGYGIHLQVWMEHGCFHVRAHDYDKGERLFWDSFDTMTEANKRYFQAKRKYGLTWLKNIQRKTQVS